MLIQALALPTYVQGLGVQLHDQLAVSSSAKPSEIPATDSERDSLHSYLHQGFTYDLPRTDTGFTVVGEWRWGPCIAAAAIGHHVLIGNGGLLQVLDMSQPEAPRIIWELKTAFVRDIKIRSPFAYALLNDASFVILDITIPADPVVLSQIYVPGIPISAAPADSFVYVTSEIGVVYVVDVSNPYTPFVRGYTIAGGSFLSRVAVRDGFVYYFSGHQAAALIIDARNPDSLTSQYFPPGIGLAGYSLLTSDTLLFAGVGGYLKVYSISVPNVPALLGQVFVNHIRIWSIAREGSRLCLNTLDSGLYVVDIASLTEPVVVGHVKRHLPARGGGQAVTTASGLVFGTLEIGLWILSSLLADSLNPVSFFPTGQHVHAIALHAGYAYAASGEAGLWILDVRNPDSIRNVGHINVGASTTNVVLDGVYAYVIAESRVPSPIDTSQGLWVMDVSDPSDPVVLGHVQSIIRFSPSLVPASISKSGSRVFITKAHLGSDSTFAIINVSNPESPTVEAVYRTILLPYQVVTRDTIALLATRRGGLRMMSVQDPYEPYELGSVLTSALGVSILDNHAHVATDTGLAIVDVSIPSQPAVLGTVRTSGSRSTVSIESSSHTVYLAYDGIHCIDVRNPSMPQETGTYPQFRGNLRLKNDSLLFVGSEGIVILRTKLVTHVRDETLTQHDEILMFQNYPNPFNDKTIIQYHLPKPTRIAVSVYSLLGQEVVRLIEGSQSAGTHRLTFDARGLASGVYYCRISTPTSAFTKPLVLIR